MKISVKARVWKYSGNGGWYFVTLPTLISKKIRKKYGFFEEGWGRLTVKSQIGKTEWTTAIWFDTKKNSYLLPIKANVRKLESIEENDLLKVIILIDEDNFNLITHFGKKV